MRAAVRADGHELHRRRPLQRAREVGHEHRRALENADQQRFAVAVVGVDLLRRARRSAPGSARRRRRRLRCRRRVRTLRLLPGDRTDLPSSLPDARPTATPPGRSTGPWPCQSVTSASRAAVCVGGERGRAGGRPPRPAGRGSGLRAGRANRDASATGCPPRPAVERGQLSAASVVQGVEVVLQQRGGAGQRLGHPALQHVVEQRQHLVAQPHPLEGRVVVVRVVPRPCRPSASHAAAVVGAADAEQRTQVAAVAPRMPAIERGPEPAAEAEQHRLGLVVEGVPEQHVRVERVAPATQRGVAGGPGGGLAARPPSPTVDRQRSRPGRTRARSRARRRCAACSAEPVLQAVIDGDQARPRRPARGASNAVAAASASESAPPEQATSTGPPRTGRTAWRTAATAGCGPMSSRPPCAHRGEARAPGTFDPSQAWTRVIQRSGSAISALVGSVSRDVQIALKSSTPIRSTTARTNADPSTYCRVLASMPSSRRSSRSSGLPPPPAPVREAALDELLARDHRAGRPRSSRTRRGPRPAT